MMTEADYNALPGLRASWAKTLWTSTPAHLLAQMESETDSDAFRFGRALHCALLRPRDYSAEFAISPKFDRRTKAGKEAAEAFEAASNGRCVIDQSEANAVDSIVSQVGFHRNARALLDMAETREAAFTGQIAGVQCKCRADAIGLVSGVLLDVKTTISASPRAFARSCAEYAYHLQMAFYRAILRENGIAVSDVVLLACEKTSPYSVAIYRMREEDLDAMEPVVARLAQLYLECVETGDYPGYGNDVRELAMPDWAIHGGNSNG